ncbi:Golgi apparatus membrane protein TVP38 [Ceratobasidium sp. AG-Ba]|nr:Golgi apparatus membrane protein TVP38 [Ceratobasidium sp. AG-Ba]
MSRNQPSSSNSPFSPPRSHSSSRQPRPTFTYTNTAAHIPNLHPSPHAPQSRSEWPNEKAQPLDDGVRRARSVDRTRVPLPQHTTHHSVDERSRPPSGSAFTPAPTYALALHSHPPPTRTPLPRYPYAPVRSPHPLRPEHSQELTLGGGACSCDVPDSLKPWIPMMIWALSSLAFLIAITYYKSEVFTGLDELSQWLQSQGYQGQFILFFLIFVTTFPPLPLYSTLIGLSGYCFGAMTGAVISYFAALSGALVVFLLSRTFLRWHIARLISHSPSFKRILRAIEKRPSLLFLIRLAPYPYNVMNVLLASSPRLTLTTYTACTALSLLKVIIHTSIGASIHSFADYHMREGAKTDEDSGLGRAWTIIGITLCVMLFMYLSWVARRAVDELDDEDDCTVAGGRSGRGPVTRSLAPVRGRRELDEEAVAFLSPAAMDESDEFVNGNARSRETEMSESPFRERSYPPTEINPSSSSRAHGGGS